MIPFIERKISNLFSDKKFSEILTGSVWALSARVLTTALGMITAIIVARFYGAEIMGIVAVLNSFLLLATIFTLLGTNTSILRLIPEYLVKYSASSAFRAYRKTQLMVMGVSLITGIVFFFGSSLIAGWIFSKPHLSLYFALAAIFIVFKSLMLLNTQAVRGLKLIKVFALMQILPQGANLVLLLLLGVFFDKRDIPVYAFLGSFAVTGLAGWTIMEYSFRRRVQPQERVVPIAARTILSVSLPMLMTASMQFLIGQTGVIFLGMFRTEAEVGYYAVAVKMATMTSFVLQAINSMAAPRFSELFHSNAMDDLFCVARKSTRLIFWTTGPVLCSLVVLGGPILSVLFGKGFAVAYPSLVFLSIGQFVNSISGSTGLFMNMAGHEKVLRNIMLGAAAINVLMSLLLIPPLGMIGAALSGMTSMVFWNIYTLLYIKFRYGRTIGYFPSPVNLFK